MAYPELDRPILLPAGGARPFDAFWVMTGKRFAGQLMHTWADSQGLFHTAEIPGARVKGRLISGAAAYEDKSGLLYLFWADTEGLYRSLYAQGSWTHTPLKPGSALAAFTHSGEVFLLWCDGQDNRITRFKPGAEPVVGFWSSGKFVDSPAIFEHNREVNVLWADTMGVVHRSWLSPNGWNHTTIPDVTNDVPAAVAAGVVDGRIYAYITQGTRVKSLLLDGSRVDVVDAGEKWAAPFSGVVLPQSKGFFAFWQNQSKNLWYGFATGPEAKNRNTAWAGLPEAPQCEPTATVWNQKLYAAWRSKDSFLKLSHPPAVNTQAITVNAATVPAVGGPAPAVVANSQTHVLWTVPSKDGTQLVYLPVQDGAVPATVVAKARELAGCAAMAHEKGVDVAYAADGKVFVSSLEGGSWKTTLVADTKIKGTLTCLGYGGKRSVFWTRADNGAIYEAQAPEWKEKKIVGAVVAGSPWAVGSGGDRYLFWRNSEGSHLYRSSELSAERARQTSSLAAGGWDSEPVIERPLKSDPVAMDVDGTVCVFWLQDNEIQGVYLSGDWKPIPPLKLTGETPARIAGVSLSGQVYFYWRKADGGLRQAAYDVKAKSWQEPKTIVDSPAASEPGAVVLAGNPQLCWLDPEGAAWTTFRGPDGSWQTEKLANPVVTRSVEVLEEALLVG